MGDVIENENGLLKRCRDLEVSQEKLREQLGLVLREGIGSGIGLEGENKRDNVDHDEYDVMIIRGYFSKNPYQRVLQYIGHAVHVCRYDTGEIIYWNQSAENLYGWRDYEAIGQRVTNLLINNENHQSFELIMEILNREQKWSGQFPFRKRSGQMFMAMVTKSPLYENNELSGVITVSSDSAILDDMDKERSKMYWNESNGDQRERKLNFGSFRPQTDIVSSVSNLAAKVISKLHPRGCPPKSMEPDNGVQNNSVKISVTEHAEEYCTPNSRRMPKDIAKDEMKRNSNERIQCSERDNSFEQTISGLPNIKKNNNISKQGLQQNGKDDAKHAPRNLANCSSISVNAVETNGRSQTGISPIRKKDVNLATECCDIHWEDLRVGEEVGQGSYAVVYRGVWNGSDVAIKVYVGRDYQESLLLNYKKEIAIMQRMRHPNVLLFMGAVYSPERLAIVTEFLPRGSLFKTLHKNNQKLDMKRRLRMALDVARGMNYLHRRNPPIIHRDLKSSNLLVDKNWTVKVGDFGLSCLKISTVFTTPSKGTPQWMAPEVLRGELSDEKSDVFSFGVILWELITESVPWSQLNPLQVTGVVGYMDRRLDLPANIDPRVSAIICNCWDSEPRRRPSFQELVGRMGELIVAVTPSLAHRRSEHPTRGFAALDDG